MTQNGCVVSVLFFQVQNVTRAPSPSSPFHSSTALLLQFGHRLSCVVVVYLVLATIYRRLLNGVGGRFPIWEGRGIVPGSTGVLRVACPWVRCRAPPGSRPPHNPHIPARAVTAVSPPWHSFSERASHYGMDLVMATRLEASNKIQ